MKKISLGLLALVGCVSNGPFNVIAVVPIGTRDLYACAMEQLYAMDYFLEDVRRPSGFTLAARIIARKKTSGGLQDFVTGEAQYSRLTVDIYDRDDGESQTLRVSSGVITDGTRGIRRMGSPSEETKSEVQALLDECSGSAG